MTKSKFINFADELPVALAKTAYGYYYVYYQYVPYDEGGPPPAAVQVRYYEWDAEAKRWTKINPDDPEPPSDLPEGQQDGQIIEVEKN